MGFAFFLSKMESFNFLDDIAQSYIRLVQIRISYLDKVAV